MYSLEGDPLEFDTPKTETPVDMSDSSKHHTQNTLQDLEDLPMGLVTWVWAHTQGLSNAVYLGFSGLVGGAAITECKAAEGRFISLGFGVFILSFITAITGVVAANSVNTHYAGLHSIDDAIAQGVTVCVEQTISLELASKYPELKCHVITDAQSITEAMAAGKCGAMLMTDNQWLTEIRSETPQCDKNKVGSVAFTVPNTIPVRTEYIPVMSWVLLKARSKGWVEQEKTIAKAKFFKRYVPECHLDQPSSKRDGQITLAQLILATANHICVYDFLLAT